MLISTHHPCNSDISERVEGSNEGRRRVSKSQNAAHAEHNFV